jgi:hypothetical protein
MLGVGMSYSSLEEVMQFTRGNARDALREITTNHTINDADYEYVLFACPDCNTLHERFWVRVEYDGDKVFETSFRCGKCRKGLVRAVRPIETYNCCNCGRQELEESPGKLWD